MAEQNKDRPDGFLGRWARRKNDALQGKPLDEPAPAKPAVQAPLAASGAVSAAPASAGAAPQSTGEDAPNPLTLDMQIRLQADNGRPTVVADPDGDVAGIYKAIARKMAITVAAKAKDFSARFPTIKISKDT